MTDQTHRSASTRQKRRTGTSRTPEYRVWQQMRLRCRSPDHPAFANYGGRGITVCDRWRDDVLAFMADMGPRPTPGHEIDRIDNDKGYEPGNCQWADRKQNARNRRSNVLLTVQSETRTIAEWAERTGLSPSVIAKRIAAGWDHSAAVETPARDKAPNGQARPKTHDCMDCGKPGISGLRCKSCENRRRGRER